MRDAGRLGRQTGLYLGAEPGVIGFGVLGGLELGLDGRELGHAEDISDFGPAEKRRLARAVIGAFAGGDEDRGGSDAGGHVGGVPGAGRVDGIVAGGESDGVGGAVGMLLVDRERARGADHHLGAVRVDFPRGPACVEAVL